jgi:hypothetical protein
MKPRLDPVEETVALGIVKPVEIIPGRIVHEFNVLDVVSGIILGSRHALWVICPPRSRLMNSPVGRVVPAPRETIPYFDALFRVT